jgi:NitT/TauT family transport system substrate-binding protein
MAWGLAAIFSLSVYGAIQPASGKVYSSSGVTVRLAHFPNITHAPAMLAVSDGRFARALGEHGLDVKVLNAGPGAMEALLAGELDIAYVGPSPAINTFLQTHGEGLRVISGACEGGASLIAAKESGIRSIRDLAGKRVASPQLGNTQDISLRHFLAKEGLKPRDKGGDVEILPMKNPDIFLQFKRNELDAAWVPEPWATRLAKEAGAVRVIDERKLWPGKRFATTVIVARTGFAKEHPDIIESILKAHAEEVDWIRGNPKDAQLAVNTELKRLTGKPLSHDVLVESWRYVDFTTDLDPNCFEAFLRAAIECGFIKDSSASVDGLVAEKDRR